RSEERLAAQDDIDVEEPRGEQHGAEQTCERALSQERGGAVRATFRFASFGLATFRRRVGPSRSDHGVLPFALSRADSPHSPAPRISPVEEHCKDTRRDFAARLPRKPVPSRGMSSRDPFASSGRVSRVARVAPLSKDPANAYHRSS